MDYAELHCVSNFSFLRGASHAEELVQQASALGYQALAITDECSVAGIVRAYSAIKDLQLSIKLIVGSEFVLASQQKIVLLCPDRAAYAELCQLITLARRRCQKGHYKLSLDDLRPLHHCLLLWLPSKHTEADYSMAKWLSQNTQIKTWITYERQLDSQELWGNFEFQNYCNHLSVRFQYPVVCAGDVHMHCPERQPLQDILTAIRLNKPLCDVGFALFQNAEHALRPRYKLQKLFPEDWLAETLEIANRCHFDLGCLRYEYPKELVPKGFTASGYLKYLVEQGMQLRFPNGVSLPIQKTLRKELKLIKEQDYEYFFLTIYDIVQYAKRHDILYQGRGSAANSIVCYCLEITAVDPEQIHMLFERFISKERNEPPDIDVDFEHQRREEIFQYIYQKYSREHAALAATVISFRFKSALRSVGKALGIDEVQLSYYLKNINRRDHSTSWQTQLEALGLDMDSLTSQHLVKLTQEIIGFPRHLSQHVGGFIISSGPLHELVPVENAAMAERTIIQWDKDDLKTLGLLKIDVLALGMLTAIRKSFELINTHYHQMLSIADITRMGDDQNVYGLLRKADSVGVFQVESRAQMSMLPRLKPASYYDLVIQIAIVSPGPIQGDMVHPYLRRRNGLEKIDYPSKEVEKVLSRTLGVPIFQEQVIELAMVAAGFSGGEADQLRRAMASWKKNGSLSRFKHKLLDGMTQRGYGAEFAERIFQQICGFGEYGFPESHSASFAVLAYVSTWLKCYYPAAFYCGLLNSLPMGFYSPSQLIQDAVRHQIRILPVDINHSQYAHTLEQGKKELALRLGFCLVRSLSKQGASSIIQQRPVNGFESISEFMRCGINKRDQEALASANAFVHLTGNRYQARWEMMSDTHHLPLFLHSPFETSVRLKAPDELHALQEDYASTGLSLEHHPITLLRQYHSLGRYTSANKLAQKEHHSGITVIGLVTGRQSPGTASGVTFVTLEDDTGNINVVIWQATARAQKQPFLSAKILKVTGILEKEGEVVHIIAGKLTDLTPLLKNLKTHSRDFH